jgi:diguanylate cyclase (GGDEF)-like protein
MSITQSTTEDEIVFLDEQGVDTSQLQLNKKLSWRIIIVDDDPDVHSATMFALGSLEIQNRSLEFLHAYSAHEAREILSIESDIAVILLDVVMEKEDAGLDLVNYIRKNLNLTDARIILRTGQPGYAPEIDAIRDYDINDYKTKSELTRTKLFTAVTSAIRSYEQICTLSNSQRGLEAIVNASTELMSQKGLQNFSSGIIQQITNLLHRKVEGFACAPHDETNKSFINDFFVISTSREYIHLRNQCVSEIIDVNIRAFITEAAAKRKNLFQDQKIVLFFSNSNQQTLCIYLEIASKLSELEQRLINVFCSNISVGLNNLSLTARLFQFAYYDPLTGLANRIKLLQILNETIQSQNKKNYVLSLIDIDHFAETNDALGHQFGDNLLCNVATRLLDHFGSSGHIARIGGDLFALLGHEDQVTHENIFTVFQTPFRVDEQDVQLSATLGLIRLNDCDGLSTDALKDTNIALKRAKNQQRSSHCYFTKDMGVEIRERVRIMHNLRAAFENKNLFVVYQPQIDMLSNRAIGAEALLRWRTEDGTFISPEQFIPIAEYSGLIIEIGEWVLKTACFELVNLQKLGFSKFTMAINVSLAQFSHPHFLQILENALKETKAPANCIELEITESMAMTDPESLGIKLQHIKNLGMQISIDDFGTGYSSLSQLQKLNVDKLKIDRAFVNEIVIGKEHSSIAKMIVQLSQNLNIKVIAEGVETIEQALILQSFGCKLAQGYLYSKPITSLELHTWLNHYPSQSN